jgi:hypothetical protein
MATHKTEKRHLVIEFEYDVKVNAPSASGRSGRRTDEEERRFIMDTIRRELKKDGGR